MSVWAGCGKARAAQLEAVLRTGEFLVMNVRPTLFLICGLPGAGKTTLAKNIERERNALRLTPDEWIAQLLSPDWDRDELDRLRSPVEELQWEMAARALTLGIDVVLDWGLWGRQERDDLRARAAALGAHAEICFVDVPREVLLARLQARNADLKPGVFEVSEAEIDLWSTWFEAPTEAELETAKYLPRASAE